MTGTVSNLGGGVKEELEIVLILGKSQSSGRDSCIQILEKIVNHVTDTAQERDTAISQKRQHPWCVFEEE